MHTLQAYTKRNTNLLHKKAVAIQMFGACISSGMGIRESCKVAGIYTGFNIRLYGSRQKEIYVNFFGFLTSLEDVADDIYSTHIHYIYIYVLEFKNLSLCTKQRHIP